MIARLYLHYGSILLRRRLELKAYEYILQWYDKDDPDYSYLSYPEHIVELRKHLPEFNHLTDFEIQFLWEEYSSNFYAAGYMGCSMGFEGEANDFKKIMLSEKPYERMYYSITEQPLPEKKSK